jgi:hypothetical protein
MRAERRVRDRRGDAHDADDVLLFAVISEAVGATATTVTTSAGRRSALTGAVCYFPSVGLHALRTIAEISRREQALVAGRTYYAGDVPGLPDKLGAIDAAVAAFREGRIPYALIGGVAVGIRSGVPRATLDVDFAIATSADRQVVADALAGHSFKRMGVFAHSMNFIHASGEPVQLAFDPAFDPMIARAEPVRFGGLELVVVTREDLLAMKRRAAADPSRRRSKALRDQADIALLEGDVPDPDEGW